MTLKVFITVDKSSWLDYTAIKELVIRDMAILEWPCLKIDKTDMWRFNSLEFGVKFHFKSYESEIGFRAGKHNYIGTATGPMAAELAALVLNAWGGTVDLKGDGGPGVAWPRIPDRYRLDAFTTAYIEAALFTSSDESREDGGDPLARNYDISAFSPLTLRRIVETCRAFQHQHSEVIERGVAWREEQGLPGDGWAQAGQDFWLTRNGHGTGFWDDGRWPEIEGKLLDDASKAAGTVDLLLDDEGKIISFESGTPDISKPAPQVATQRLSSP